MSKYIIHACPQRMWYVNEFLLPSMRQQGIEDIVVECDDQGLGNLEKCMQIFGSMPDEGGAWHMQDDVIICRDFKAQTEILECNNIVCGFVTHTDGNIRARDPGPLNMWWSFPCIYIPNHLAKDCATWYQDMKYHPKYVGYTKENKFDDAIFRESLIALHPHEPIIHHKPSLVDHIDYLIGGTTINQGRHASINRAVYFEDTDLVDDLERKIKERNEDKIKAAVYTGTRNLYEHMVPAVKSLLANSDVDKIYLLIEDGEFPYELPDMVETMNVSGQTFFPPDNPNSKSRFTYMAMIRVAFTKIFPDLNKILSLDVDTIAVKDVSEIWDAPIGENYIAACYEPDRSTKDYLYTNAGVCLQNLRKLRDSRKDDLLIEKLNTEEHKFLDQDVQNIYLQGGIYNLPSMYNFNEYCAPTQDPRIVHYAGQPAWFYEQDYLNYKKKSWDEILKLRKERYGK